MKVPLSWLKKYINLNFNSQEEQDEFIHKFATQLVDVEEVLNLSEELDEIIVGQITKIENHPDADKLVVCQVEIGDGKTTQIVTGAPNVNEGDWVPVVLPGTSLPGGFKIEERKLRGVESAGMMCSQKEMNLGQDHSGIMILNDLLENPKAGQNLNEALELNEGILDLDSKIITNRPYAFGIYGLARETSAMLDEDLNPLNKLDLDVTKDSEEVDIIIKDKNACWRISGLVVKDVKITKSPWWMQKALLQVGIRPINNIVDITNYVMYDFGHPMHAFDLDKLAKDSNGKSQISARYAESGEKLLTLDGVQRDLSDKDFIISDLNGPVGLAGIMGGGDSEVTEETKNILLVAERFDPIVTRTTVKNQKVITEASSRFEKGLDPNNTTIALGLAAQIIKEQNWGTPDSKIVDNYQVESHPTELEFHPTRVKKVIGADISEEFMKQVLNRFDIKIIKETSDVWTLEIPTYKRDVTLEIDIVEDIARMHGYDNLESTVPTGKINPPITNPELATERKVRSLLSQLGYYELKTPTFISSQYFQDIGYDTPAEELKVINAGSDEYEYLRPSMAPTMIKVSYENLKNFEQVKVYELDKVYKPSGGEYTEKDHYDSARPLELKRITLANSIRSPKVEKEKIEKLVGSTIVEMKTMLAELGIKTTEELVSDVAEYQLTDSVVALKSNDKVLGSVYLVHPERLRQNKKEGVLIAIADLDFAEIFRQYKAIRTFEDFSTYPAVKEDFTFDVDPETKVLEIRQKLDEYEEPSFSYEIYDIYEAEGQKSISIHAEWRAKNKTLNESEVLKHREKFMDYLGSKGLKIRE